VRFLPLLVLAACAASALTFLPPDGDTVTVFVHGYRGSFLVTDNAQRDRVYLNPVDVLFSGSANLALAYEGQTFKPTYSALTADGPLTKLTLIPGIVTMDVYQSWMQFGRDALPGFIPFAYDWRQDVRASGQALCERLEQLPAKKLQIVAHSMGGLVTWSCLASNEAIAQRVTKIVFAGTPFRGGPGIFDDLFLGSSTGRDRSMLSPQALFTFASSHQLLSAKSDFFVDASGAPVPFDAFSADTWVMRKWGLFAGEWTDADKAQLQRMLAAHDDLHALLALPMRGAPQVMAIIGYGQPTVSGVRVIGDTFDFEHPPTADGDGSVLLTSAVPPMDFQRVDTTTEHVALLNDEAVQRAILNFLATKVE